ncbi:MAG: GGDEF domain-containing protein [Bacilli bacterium]
MNFQAEFDLLIHDYSLGKISSEPIVSLMLNNISNSKEYLKCISTFRDEAEKLNNSEDYAFSFAMLFWNYYVDDLDRALEYNNEADKLFKKIDNYEKSRGYLSVLNNYLIAYNSTGDIEKAYACAREGLGIAKKYNLYQYIAPFSNNFSYLLNIIGLPKLCIKNLQESINNLAYLPNYLALATIELYVDCLLNEHMYDEAYKWSFELLKKDKEFKSNKKCIYSRFLLDYYISNDDKSEAKKIFNEMQTGLKQLTNISIDDRVSVYIVFAKYYEYIQDIDEAEKTYDYIYDNIYNYLGDKAKILSKISEFYASINDYERAFKAKKESETFLAKYLKVVSQYSDLSATAEAFDKEAYKILYNKARQLTLIFNKLNPLATTIDISSIISSDIKQVIDASSCELFFAHNDDNLYEFFVYHNGKNTVLDFKEFNEPLMDNLIKNHEIINILSINCELAKYYDGEIGTNSTLIPFYDDSNKLLAVLWVTSNFDLIYKEDEDSLLPLICDHIRKMLITLEKYSNAVNIATIDYLTQVNNRHGLAKRIQELNQKVSSYDLVVFDIDNFKSINDNYGHLTGDEILKDFAYELTVYFRSENVARFGGEEFIVLSTLEREELEKVLEMFKTEFVSRKYNRQGKEFSIGFSAGVARCKKSSSHEKALRTADKLLYKSKSLGKGHIFFDEDNK